MSKTWHSICFWGTIQDDKGAWHNFFERCAEFASVLPLPITHFGAGSDSISGGNYLVFNTRGRNRLTKALLNGESFSFLSLLSVPEDFKTMAFDANFSCSIFRSNHARFRSTPWCVHGDFRKEQLDTQALIPAFEKLGRNLFSSAHIEEFCIDDLPTNYICNVNPTDEASRQEFASGDQIYTRLRAEFYDQQSEHDAPSNGGQRSSVNSDFLPRRG